MFDQPQANHWLALPLDLDVRSGYEYVERTGEIVRTWGFALKVS